LRGGRGRAARSLPAGGCGGGVGAVVPGLSRHAAGTVRLGPPRVRLAVGGAPVRGALAYACARARAHTHARGEERPRFAARTSYVSIERHCAHGAWLPAHLLGARTGGDGRSASGHRWLKETTPPADADPREEIFVDVSRAATGSLIQQGARSVEPIVRIATGRLRASSEGSAEGLQRLSSQTL
jgi:hypothetical protein